MSFRYSAIRVFLNYVEWYCVNRICRSQRRSVKILSKCPDQWQVWVSFSSRSRFPYDATLPTFQLYLSFLWQSVYKSGFFYINGTFYNDTSEPSNIDYSKIIRKWAETRDIGPFKVAPMNARIDSLCVRFGYPWVYQHQGCCEHIIVLSDAR
jgi:snRNA-activating protein complex subunit 3